MKVRLIKPALSSLIENQEKPPDETQLINTVRLWVQDFKTRKAKLSSVDLQRINEANPRKRVNP